jgi:hydroxypyruvate reductase
MIARQRQDALAIWSAGVDAVRSDHLVCENVRVLGRQLNVGGETIDLDRMGRILVVGTGKAGAGMAAGLEAALGPRVMADKRLTGWVHVPENCVRKLSHIHLHAARPAALNEPTQTGVDGSREMLRLVASLGPDDACIALISGGGSALLPYPIEGVTLDDKLAVTRFLSAAGAPIDDLNTVRRELSRIKGGGLARACGAGRLFALIISDVLGDPLDLIASGPTVARSPSSQRALDVLERYGAREAGISSRVFEALERRDNQPQAPLRTQVTNLVIGNNALAVRAAAQRAGQLGYVTTSESASASEGAAEDVGRRLAGTALAMRSAPKAQCLVSGGEPTVKLIDAPQRGLGGRNQQLVLAALARLRRDGADRILMLSGGTDGEDGPTDAAGAFFDAEVLAAASQRGLDPADYLARNDAYRFFEPLAALVKTGPTNTNVCDVRVVLVSGAESDA